MLNVAAIYPGVSDHFAYVNTDNCSCRHGYQHFKPVPEDLEVAVSLTTYAHNDVDNQVD